MNERTLSTSVNDIVIISLRIQGFKVSSSLLYSDCRDKIARKKILVLAIISSSMCSESENLAFLSLSVFHFLFLSLSFSRAYFLKLLFNYFDCSTIFLERKRRAPFVIIVIIRAEYFLLFGALFEMRNSNL